MTAKKETPKPSTDQSEAPLLLWGATEMARLLDMSPRNLQLLAARGVAVKLDRGKYDVHETVKRFIADIRAGQTQDSVDVKAQTDKENLRLKTILADTADLKLAILRGDAVLMPDVEALFISEYGKIRLGFSQVSGSVARKLAEEDKPAVCQDIVARAIEGVLKNLTADQPGGKRPRTRHLPGAEGLEDGDINAAN